MEHLRERFRNQISHEDQNYQQILRHILNLGDGIMYWCHQQGSDPFLGPTCISELANFLIGLFEEGVNTYRSAILQSTVRWRIRCWSTSHYYKTPEGDILVFQIFYQKRWKGQPMEGQ